MLMWLAVCLVFFVFFFFFFFLGGGVAESSPVKVHKCLIFWHFVLKLTHHVLFYRCTDDDHVTSLPNGDRHRNTKIVFLFFSISFFIKQSHQIENHSYIFLYETIVSVV